MENKLNKLFYAGLTVLILMMLVEMEIYGWNESFYYSLFPFSLVWPFRIHYITAIVCAALAMFTMNVFKSVGFLKSLSLFTLLVLMGLSSYELMWHYAIGSISGIISPLFWVWYTMMTLFFFVYGRRRWTKYQTPRINALAYTMVYIILFFIWGWYATTFNFYSVLHLYDIGKAQNPHSILFFLFKSAVLLLPLILIKRGEVKC